MNEELLTKYVKALPGKMLSEYDASVAGGATGTAVNSGETKSSGARDNKNRFPFLGPLLVIVAAAVTVAAVVVVQSRKKNGSTDPYPTSYQISDTTATPEPTGSVTESQENETPVPTAAPTATFTPAPADTATQPTPADTATLPPSAPTATFTPAPTDTATQPAPADTATLPPSATPAQDPDHIKVNHLDPVITKGELYVGETLQLSYIVTPENYNYGTIRWKLTSGFDCAAIDPETGVLTALKPGSVGVLPYVEEYETKNSPAGIVILEKETQGQDYKEPEHEQELPAKYRPDAGLYGDAWTEERVNIRNSFLVYNCRTPDDLPAYKRRPTDEIEYRNSPYENDLSLFVMFRESSYSGNMDPDRIVKHKGVKVTFTDAKTGSVVGYSYTNADGIAMFTIKKQEIDFIVTAELNGYTFDYLELEEERHIIYPGGGTQGSTGPYTNCGIAQWYELRTNSEDAVKYTFRTVNASTGEVLSGGRIDIYYQESTSLTLESEYGGYTAVAFDDFFDSIRTITYEYGEGYPKKRAENCTFRREGNVVTVYADISDDTP